ncbi:MAG: hypothetical protein ACE5HV_09925 [Acidobacteriota bacterium]
MSRNPLTLVPAVAVLFTVANLSTSDPLWSRVIASWPDTAKTTAMEIAQKYGPPDIVGGDLLVWENVAPYVWIRVNSEEVHHNFPVEHKDVLDIAIPYKVPVSMHAKVAEFDGSAMIMRTQGLLVASCFKEGLDIAILNLANDVVRGEKTPAEERMAFAKVAMGMMNGEKNPYTEALQFETEPLSATRVPDKPFKMKM